MDMDQALDGFLNTLLPDIGCELDYSSSSLSILEAWLLRRYASLAEALVATESRVVDGAARYVGEVLRNNLGASKWFIDFSDEKNAFYGLPQLKDLPGQVVQACPLTLVTTAIDRRTGSFLQKVYLNAENRARI
ncbi:hypothetical protein [Stenotrophomonas ginsengisoli]|uniref:hypothetical protein n=1 Tax=Stenotrophomonas ginsengisoli TaxID=336566 RepID=UPI00128FBA32|nr:hypothetical protein [Stenotrophomonas ginsengisoli]